MLTEFALETTIRCIWQTSPSDMRIGLVDLLPEIPVLPTTLLHLHLLAQERYVDLAEISRVVLEDIGATLQMFRRVSAELGAGQSLPTRIEDCISELGLEGCLKAVAAQNFATSGPGNLAVIWEHSRKIAHHCRLLAESTGEINPEEAYLVGLLHEMGVLPKSLGWPGDPGDAESCAEGLGMAVLWSLPECVQEYFGAECEAGYFSKWTVIVRRAHQECYGSWRGTIAG